MNAVEIEEAISKLAEQLFEAEEFPYLFLQAFGNKETTLKRLRKGESNKSDLGGVLQTNNIHIAVAAPGKVSNTLAALKASPATMRAKAKFVLATDGDMFEAEDLASGETVACVYADIPDHFGFFEMLAGQLRRAATLTPALFAHLISETCIRLPALGTAFADRIARRVEVGAWTDVALALIEVELPMWKLRRLSFEDDEWLCSLSNRIYFPTSLDDTADARHAVFPLAILCAFVEARRRSDRPCRHPPQYQYAKPSILFSVCCDNFG
jgi:hypothetical protein